MLIDGDMLVLRNMDELLSLPDKGSTPLPPDWIAANHACICNLYRQPWAPEDWPDPPTPSQFPNHR